MQHSLILVSLLQLPFVVRPRLLEAKLWKQLLSPLLSHPSLGLLYCTIPGSLVHTADLSVDFCSAQPEQLCACAQRCVLQTCWPHSHTVWMARKKRHREITLVNISKTLHCHLRKLWKEEVPRSLDSYLEVWLAQNIKGECDLPLPALPYPLPSGFITKEKSQPASSEPQRTWDLRE